MGWEIVKRTKAYALWQSTDVEGRTIYSATSYLHGVAYEPTGIDAAYSQKQAIASHKEAMRMTREAVERDYDA